MIDEHRGWDWTRAGLWDGMGWDGMDGNQCAAEECEAKLWVLAALVAFACSCHGICLVGIERV